MGELSGFGDHNHAANATNAAAPTSAARFAAFGNDRLGPAMAQAGVGVEPQVTFHEAHEVFLPEALTFTAT